MAGKVCDVLASYSLQVPVNGHEDAERLELGAAATDAYLFSNNNQIAEVPHRCATGLSGDDFATSWTSHKMVMEAVQRAVCREKRAEQEVELQVGLWKMSNN